MAHECSAEPRVENARIAGTIKAISISQRKGVPKTNVSQAELRRDHGLVGDAHAGPWHRQVSLLAVESIDRLRNNGTEIGPGSFAENITTQGLDLTGLRVGSRLRIGGRLELEVTQIGKRCHGRCAIFEQLGDCVMPREGVFAQVLNSGCIHVGDTVEVADEWRTGTDE